MTTARPVTVDDFYSKSILLQRLLKIVIKFNDLTIQEADVHEDFEWTSSKKRTIFRLTSYHTSSPQFSSAQTVAPCCCTIAERGGSVLTPTLSTPVRVVPAVRVDSMLPRISSSAVGNILPRRMSCVLLKKNASTFGHIRPRKTVPTERRTFPSRQPSRHSSAQQVASGKYHLVVDQFGTYERLINFCASESISLTPQQRRDAMKEFEANKEALPLLPHESHLDLLDQQASAHTPLQSAYPIGLSMQYSKVL